MGNLARVARSASATAYLGRHHEVVARQTRGGVSRQLERRPAPAELDVRMVALGLGDQRDARDEAERVAEVLELELAAQGAGSSLAPSPETSAASAAASSSASGGVPFSQGSQCCLASSLIGRSLAN